jgi:hypothetical protein
MFVVDEELRLSRWLDRQLCTGVQLWGRRGFDDV